MKTLSICILISLSVIAGEDGRFSDESNKSMLNSMQNRDCETILDALIETHVEASRLSIEAFKRIDTDENDKHGLALATLSDGAYKRVDMLRDLFSDKCLKTK